MKINRIELYNYRPFKGPHEVDFTVNGKHLILIRGLNGAGKTSFFHAVNFVFFGESFSERGRSVNVRAAGEGNGETSVKIFLEHENQKYELRRTLTFKKTSMITKNSAGDWEIAKGADVTDEEFSAKEDHDIPWPSGEGEKKMAQRMYINKIIPEEASKYYLFDGEKVKEYTATGPNTNNEEVIQKIIGIRAIDNTISDLKKVEREEYGKRVRLAKTSVPEVQALQEKATKAEEKKEDLKKAIDNLTIKNNNAKRSKKENQKWLEDNLFIKDCFENIEKAEGKKEAALSALEKVKESESQFRSTNFPILITLELLDKIKAKKEIGATKDQSLIDAANESISHGKCTFCEQDLNPAAKERLETLSTKTVDGLNDFARIYHIFAGKHASPALVKEWKTIKSKSVTNSFLLQSAEDTIKENKEKIPQEAERQGRASAEEAWQRRAELAQKLDIQISDFEKDVDGAKNEFKAKSEEIDQLEREINEVGGKSDAVIAQFSQLSSNAKDFIKKFEILKTNLVEKQRDAIEQRATSVLLQIKSDNEKTWREIKLGKAMELRVLKEVTLPDGSTELASQTASADEWGSFSEGQRNIASFSFVEGVTDFAAEKRTFFIDTPFARLDAGHTYGMAKYLADTKQQQTVILYQPDEIKGRESGFDELLNKAAHHYEVTSTTDGWESEIKPVTT